MHTVGILGINGNLGKPTTRLLVQAAEQDKIHLIIFHRQGKSGEFKAGKNVELRMIDLDGPKEKIEEAVKGVNVFVSTVGVAGLPSEVPVVEALAKSPDIATFMPAKYSTTWNKKDFEDPMLGPIMAMMPGWTKAADLNLGMTKVYTGVFDFTLFETGFLYQSLKENKMTANDKMLKNPLPITTMPHLAEYIARLATNSDPASIKNTDHSVISFWAPGSELRDIFTKLHGKPTEVQDWTSDVREAKKADMASYGPVQVGYIDKWENQTWEYETGGKIVDRGYKGPGLEEVVRKFL